MLKYIAAIVFSTFSTEPTIAALLEQAIYTRLPYDIHSGWPLNINSRYKIQLNLGLRYQASSGAWYLFRLPMATKASASLAF